MQTRFSYQRGAGFRFKGGQFLLAVCFFLSACQAPASPARPTALAAATPTPQVQAGTPPATAEPTPTPFPTLPVEPQLAWFYKPPENVDLATVAGNFEIGILSNGNEPERDQLRKLKMGGPFLQYLRFDVIQDPGSCSRQPWKNQVANQPGDYCRLSSEHPDWFLRDQNGKLLEDPYGGENFVMMDPGNPFWRAFWLSRARQAQEQGEWDGIFLDNVEVTFAFREDRKQIPAAYPDEASYQKAVQDFVAYIHTDLSARGKLLFANLVARGDDSDWTRYLAHLDGAMHEGWAIDWPDGYRDVDTWLKHLQLAEDTQALGKTIVLISQGKQEQEELQAFAYGSYLLVMQGRAYFRYANSKNYRQAWLYPNYELDLGKPAGNRYAVGDAWRRDFEFGWVEVNPKTHKVQIEKTSTAAGRAISASGAVR